ncbi:MAG: cell division protein FtsQ/DivIB [Alphaproteobacteria bacterium]|nr:cell division protein FtsQ/DivIB [Rickettsiales bacterium]
MALNTKLFNEKEFIWRRRGILFGDFIKRYSVLVFTACLVLFLFVAYITFEEMFQESSKAYSFFANSITKSVSQKLFDKDSKIVVLGVKNIQSNEIKAIIKKTLSKGKDINNIHSTLVNCPLIKAVHVRRNVISNETVINITERQWVGGLVSDEEGSTVLGIDLDGGTWDLSNFAYVLKDLVIIKNAKNNIEGFLDLHNYLKYLKIQQHLQEAKMISNRRWNIKMKNGLLIKLPALDWHSALKTMMLVDKKIDLLSKNNKFTYIDLRVKKKIFLQ